MFGAQTPPYPSSRLQRYIKGWIPHERGHVGWCKPKAEHPGWWEKNLFWCLFITWKTDHSKRGSTKFCRNDGAWWVVGWCKNLRFQRRMEQWIFTWCCPRFYQWCSFVPCDRKRVQPGTLVHVLGEVGHVEDNFMLEITNGNWNMVFCPVMSFFMASMASMALTAFIICMPLRLLVFWVSHEKVL